MFLKFLAQILPYLVASNYLVQQASAVNRVLANLLDIWKRPPPDIAAPEDCHVIRTDVYDTAALWVEVSFGMNFEYKLQLLSCLKLPLVRVPKIFGKRFSKWRLTVLLKNMIQNRSRPINIAVCECKNSLISWILLESHWFCIILWIFKLHFNSKIVDITILFWIDS